MLDPMSALSVAASAVQFVDFSIKMVSKGKKIYKSTSGALEENLQPSRSAEMLVRHKEGVWNSLRVGAIRPPLAISDSQADLLELCENCLEMGGKLADRLRSLEVKEGEKHRRWKSIRQALKSEWGKKEVNEMRDSLTGYKSDLMLYILISAQENINLSDLRHADDTSLTTRHLDERVRIVLDGILKSHRALKTEIGIKANTVLTSQMATEEKIIAESSKMVQEMRNLENSEDQQTRWMRTNNSLLGSLRFTEINDRYETISEAEMNTFSWIFDDTPNMGHSWSNLSNWLQRGGGIYWINGKAGSGKSTLMRYIYEHSKTREHLSLWAGDSPLVLAGFFFWNSGVLQQRTQAGLLQTLLYQILSQRVNLLPEVMPEQWKHTYERPLWTGEEYYIPGFWPVTQLQKCFALLVRRSIGVFNIGLFIDGLDEHDRDHKSLISFLENLALSENIKILTSSRPLVEFETAFADHPTLSLQDLTYRDIKIYVDTRLRKDKSFLGFYKKEPKGTIALVKEIVDSAEGVFLWVRLVVDSLLEGITYRDRLRDLKSRLRALPKDLEGMFQHMLDRVHREHKACSSRILLLIRSHLELFGESEYNPAHPFSPHGDRRIYALLLSFAQEEREDIISGPPKPLSQTEISDRCEEIQTWLKSRCSGLLEARDTVARKFSGGSKDTVGDINREVAAWPDPPCVVSYIHRCARDFLEQDHIWTSITSHTVHTDFHPFHAWTRGWIMFLKWTAPFPQVQKIYKISLPGIAIDSADRDATPLPTWCPTTRPNGAKTDESSAAATNKTEILKTMAFWLIDSVTSQTCISPSVLSFIFQQDWFSQSGGYLEQAFDTRERRCINCKEPLDLPLKLPPVDLIKPDEDISHLSTDVEIASEVKWLGLEAKVARKFLFRIRRLRRRRRCPPSSLDQPTLHVPGFVCHFVLEDGDICSQVFLSYEEIEAHFKDHLWEGKATPKSLEATETSETISPEFGEFPPGFLVGGLD